MGQKLGFIKTTILGGLVFLLPLVAITAVVGQAIKIMIEAAKPLDALIPIESIGGIALVNILAIASIVLCCFLAGLAARSLLGKKLFDKIDTKLMALPGYALFKSRLTGNIGRDVEKKALKPVMVSLGPKSQIGFEVERLKDGRLTIFLPGAPDPWSGSIVFVKEEQIAPIDTDAFDAMRIFGALGHGANEIVK